MLPCSAGELFIRLTNKSLTGILIHMATKSSSISKRVILAAHAHFFYIFAFVASVIVYDASQLITPEAVLKRWQYAAMLMVVTTGVWYFARTKENNQALLKWLVGALVLTDILFASFLVYGDRGMSSIAVALFAVPIVTSAVLLNRSAVLATASLSTAAYAFTAVKYFVDYFNEGYKVQLYSTIGFYGATFFVIALLLIAAIGKKQNR